MYATKKNLILFSSLVCLPILLHDLNIWHILLGDFVQFHSKPIDELCQRYLKRLEAKYGVWCVLGNHDYKEGKKGVNYIMNTLRSHGIHLLDNEACYPIDGNKKFELVGLGDLMCRGNSFILYQLKWLIYRFWPWKGFQKCERRV